MPDRVAFVADLALNWIRLRRAETATRKIAIILANYPNKDGRLANGVGYDTPASTIAILNALAQSGYSVSGVPDDGNHLISDLKQGPTNAPSTALSNCRLTLQEYTRHFSRLPERLRAEVVSKWGTAEDDPSFREDAFQLAIKLYGNVAVGIQPARGYNIDPKASYHDPALVPPHGYFAFYFWVRHRFGAHAIVHNGKHGNLEWLPGKATSLSETCYPEAVFGPLPQVYPFIVNDPGEGTQAKRRTSAVIIDHLTPPLTRAETYGPLRDLEALVDEYYLASGLDRRRLETLRKQILELSQSHRIDIDAAFTGEDDSDLQKLDGYLCDLKEAQIRDGLHVLGSSPEGRLQNDTLVALTRVPRGLGEGKDESIIRALAGHFRFENFDPLVCNPAEPWVGPRPDILNKASADPWRTCGDTVERLELLASQLVKGDSNLKGDASPQLMEVLNYIDEDLRPTLKSCGPNELSSLLAALNGCRVEPGPSGAPTRGRLDVLPTGRNFYSLDNRSVPTPTAWTLGRTSAEDLLARHFQDFGAYPKALGFSPGEVPICAPAATISRKPWRSSASSPCGIVRVGG